MNTFEYERATTEHVHPTDAPAGDDVCAHLDMGHAMMSMSFHLGYCENVMFDWWKIRDVGTLIGSCIAIFLFAMLYELVKRYREHLWSVDKKINSCCRTGDSHGSQEKLVIQFQSAVQNKFHGVQTILHMFQVIISYFLMLIVMTYNFWLCLAVILGAGCGFFLFGWNKKEASHTLTEHCH